MRSRCVIGYADFRKVSKTNTIVFPSCKQAVFFSVCIPHTANGWFMVTVISRCSYALYTISCTCMSTYHLICPSQPWHVCKDPSRVFSIHMGHIIMSTNKGHWTPVLLPNLYLLVIKSNWPRNQHTYNGCLH